MAVSKRNILSWMVLVLVFYFFYNDFLLFTIEGMTNAVEKAVQDAISKSGYKDLELSSISEYHCPRDPGQDYKEVRTLHCSASAVFTDGTSADVSIEQKEFRNTYIRSGRKEMNTYKIIFSVIVQEPDPNVRGVSSISKIIKL